MRTEGAWLGPQAIFLSGLPRCPPRTRTPPARRPLCGKGSLAGLHGLGNAAAAKGDGDPPAAPSGSPLWPALRLGREPARD